MLPLNFLNISEDLEKLASALIRWKLEALSVNTSAINSVWGITNLEESQSLQSFNERVPAFAENKKNLTEVQ